MNTILTRRRPTRSSPSTPPKSATRGTRSSAASTGTTSRSASSKRCRTPGTEPSPVRWRITSGQRRRTSVGKADGGRKTRPELADDDRAGLVQNLILYLAGQGWSLCPRRSSLLHGEARYVAHSAAAAITFRASKRRRRVWITAAMHSRVDEAFY